MPVKIRLQRHGKKGKPFFWIVAADGRSKRDGRLLEKLGTYNPNTNPAIINLDIDGAVKWLQNGAQPTDTARAILSYKGVMLKNHLAGGVRKGALTEEQAEAKFNAWLEEKDGSVTAKTDKLAQAKDEAKAKALEVEKEVSEARRVAAVEVTEAAEAAEVAAQVAEAAEDAVEAVEEVAEEAVAEEVVAEVTEEVKEVTEEVKEVVAEKVEEVKEATEEVVAETATDTEASKEEE